MKIKRERIKIPDNIMDKVKELEAERKRRNLADKQARQAERERLNELKKVKKSREAELRYHATVVIEWLFNFLNSCNGKRLFRVVGRIRIFNARFWRGYPIEGNSISESATVEIDKLGNLTYGERSKGLPSHDTSLGKIPFSPNRLIQKLHPDFLKQFSEHLTSGKVWDYIESSMPKMVY